MGLFERLRKKRDRGQEAQVERVLRFARQQGVQLDASQVGRDLAAQPRLRLYRCPGRCPGPSLVFWIGDRDPNACSTCGRRLSLVADASASDSDLLPKTYLAGHCYREAMRLAGIGRLTDAIAALTQTIALCPSFGDAYYNRGELRIQLDDLEGGLADCNAALRIDPRDSDAYINRASVRGQKGDFEGAVEDSTKAIELGSTKPIAYFNRGFALIQLGRSEAGRSDLKRFLTLAPNDPRAESVRALIRMTRAG